MLDVDAFRKNYLVAGLSDDQVAQIVTLAALKKFSAQEDIIRAGESSSDLFVMLDGRAKVITEDGDLLGEVGPGSVLGEIALVDARPRTATVISVGMVDTAVIPAAEFRSLLNRNRDMGFVVLANLSRVLAGRLRLANLKIDELYDKTTDTWDRAL